MEVAGCCSDHSVYDASVYQLHGMDSVHAEKRSVPAAVPLDGKHLGIVLFAGGIGTGHELSCVSVHDNDD